MTESARPLAGLKVLDLSRVLAGPFCCQILADLGADVVKVERPGSGDDTRAWGPPFVEPDGPSAYYLSANRGKRSLSLDLASPKAKDVLERLLQKADVMVENFLPHTAAKLGLSPERLVEINPRLVSCAISGFGRTGPLAETPGYDLAIQAGSGLMSITGEPDGQPMKVGVAISDVIAGLYAAVSVLAGLVERERRERGERDGESVDCATMAFDLALADCTLSALVNVAQGALVTGNRPRRYGNAHPHIVPYQAFATLDGHIALAIGNDGQWRRFCRGVGRDALGDESRYATNPERVRHREELIPIVEGIMRGRTTAEWENLLAANDVPHAAVATLDAVFGSPQTMAREMIETVTDSQGREYRLIGSPIHWRGEPKRSSTAPPSLGEHTDEVLRDWLGIGDAGIELPRKSGGAS